MLKLYAHGFNNHVELNKFRPEPPKTVVGHKMLHLANSRLAVADAETTTAAAAAAPALARVDAANCFVSHMRVESEWHACM